MFNIILIIASLLILTLIWFLNLIVSLFSQAKRLKRAEFTLLKSQLLATDLSFLEIYHNHPELLTQFFTEKSVIYNSTEHPLESKIQSFTNISTLLSTAELGESLRQAQQLYLEDLHLYTYKQRQTQKLFQKPLNKLLSRLLFRSS